MTSVSDGDTEIQLLKIGIQTNKAGAQNSHKKESISASYLSTKLTLKFIVFVRPFYNLCRSDYTENKRYFLYAEIDSPFCVCSVLQMITLRHL